MMIAVEDLTLRDLDLLVLEHVQGWEWWMSPSTGGRALFAPSVIPRFPDEWFTERATGTEPLVFNFDKAVRPQPSTDIAAAKAATDAMIARSWNYGMIYVAPGALGERAIWVCQMMRLTDSVFVSVEASTESLARAKAALMAATCDRRLAEER